MTTESYRRLIVAITGAQGVGKTTLAAALKLEFDRQVISPCFAHHNLGASAASRGVSLGENANLNSILEFSRLHIKRERQMAKGAHILDRCFVDVFAYARQLCADQTILLSLVEELTLNSLAKISLVVRIPIISCLSESRSVNESSAFRFEIEKTICGILNDLAINRIDLVSDTPEERVHEVMAALKTQCLLN